MSKLITQILYKTDHLVEIYNKTFPDDPINSISFGKLKDVQNNFIKYRKRVNGKMQTDKKMVMILMIYHV